jgi:type IV pilus assembly protein PilV
MHTLKVKSKLLRKRRQTGISLIESLVALVVLALGVMGLAGVQTRLLVETRTANSRAVAIQLIDDLTNRMALNRYAAVGQPQLTTPVASSYAINTFSSANGLAQPTPATCLGTTCTSAQLAAVDLFAWRTAVDAALPGSLVRIIQNTALNGDPRQLGITIAWPLNERNGLGVDVTSNAALTSAGVNTAGVNDCPASLICHIVYVQP